MDTAVTEKLLRLYEERFQTTPPAYVLAQAPGRVELAGNHTDHQGGMVISSATDLRVHILAAPQRARTIDLWAKGHGDVSIDLDETGWDEARECEKSTSASLVRGMAAQLADAGMAIGGCRMVVVSDVPEGSGLSSSAAFEMAVGAALKALFAADNGAGLSPVQLALSGVAAEQRYYGKPCGAQDQLASSLGGVVAMDFANYPPTCESLDLDLEACGFLPCFLDCLSDHARFTDEFARIPADMHSVAAEMGRQRLEDVDPSRFYTQIAPLRAKLGDAAVLRALHYFEETARVKRQREALLACDFGTFLRLMRESGVSSAQFLQNIEPRSQDGTNQPAMILLGLCAAFLKDEGAWRIHGGGFGGGVIALVPASERDVFETHMVQALGYNPCRWLQLNQPGAQAVCFNQEK